MDAIPENCFCIHTNLVGCTMGLCWLLHIFSIFTSIVLLAMCSYALYLKRLIKSPVNSSVYVLIWAWLYSFFRLLYHLILVPFAGSVDYFQNPISPIYGAEATADIVYLLTKAFFLFMIAVLFLTWFNLYYLITTNRRSKIPLTVAIVYISLCAVLGLAFAVGCSAAFGGTTGPTCNVVTLLFFIPSYTLPLFGLLMLYVSFVLIKKATKFSGASPKVVKHLLLINKIVKIVLIEGLVFVIFLVLSSVLRTSLASDGYDFTFQWEHITWDVIEKVGLVTVIIPFGFTQSSKKLHKDVQEHESRSMSATASGSVSASGSGSRSGSRSGSVSGSASASMSVAV